MSGNDNQVDAAQLDRLGIVRVMTESFTWGGYRYGNARDAIAAATRSAKK
jgi:hypothetical protein